MFVIFSPGILYIHINIYITSDTDKPIKNNCGTNKQSTCIYKSEESQLLNTM